ncbi:MAG: hypothetical protein ACKO5E_22005 [bacterium]
MLRNFSKVFGIVALTIAMIGTGAKTASAQSKSQNISISTSGTPRVNVPFTVTARLTDAWSGVSLPGRMLEFGVGQEFWYSNRGSYNTNNSGQATAQMTFNTRGKHRIVVSMPDAFGYLFQRQLIFVNVQ